MLDNIIPKPVETKKKNLTEWLVEPVKLLLSSVDGNCETGLEATGNGFFCLSQNNYTSK